MTGNELKASLLIDVEAVGEIGCKPGMHCSDRSRRISGFTLLELMIVITIVVILAAVALPRFEGVIVHAREATLKDDLTQMRKAIDQYAADKGKLPQTLDDLASSNYLREVPLDPMTGQKDWNQVSGDDPASVEGGQGLTDVHSSSSESSSEGTAYSEW